MTTCTTPGCHRITSLYLCTDCIIELDDLLKDVPVLVKFLEGPLRKTSVTRPPGAGGGGGVAGSTPPLSIDAFLLRDWLWQLPDRAHAVAMEDPDAGQVMYMARLWVKQARDLVWGPEELRVYGECEEPIDGGDDPTLCWGKLTARPDDVSVTCPDCAEVHQVADLQERINLKVRGEPMAPRQVREYLQSNARAFILKKDFENWVQLGRLPYVLDRVNSAGTAKRLYFPGDVLTVHEEMKQRRRVLV